jgi:hypothetical protein
MTVPAFVMKPAVKMCCVATSIVGLRDVIPEAGVRGAIGWCAAEFIIEAWIARFRRARPN